jgi:hypothetical protein
MQYDVVSHFSLLEPESLSESDEVFYKYLQTPVSPMPLLRGSSAGNTKGLVKRAKGTTALRRSKSGMREASHAYWEEDKDKALGAILTREYHEDDDVHVSHDHGHVHGISHVSRSRAGNECTERLQPESSTSSLGLVQPESSTSTFGNVQPESSTSTWANVQPESSTSTFGNVQPESSTSTLGLPDDYDETHVLQDTDCRIIDTDTNKPSTTAQARSGDADIPATPIPPTSKLSSALSRMRGAGGADTKLPATRSEHVQIRTEPEKFGASHTTNDDNHAVKTDDAAHSRDQKPNEADVARRVDAFRNPFSNTNAPRRNTSEHGETSSDTQSVVHSLSSRGKNECNEMAAVSEVGSPVGFGRIVMAKRQTKMLALVNKCL